VKADSASVLKLAGVVSVCVATVWAAAVLGGSYTKARTSSKSMSITGSARQTIESDFIIWSASIEAYDATPQDAYAKLQDARDQTIAYLKDRGLSDDEIVIEAIRSETIYVQTNKYVQGDVYREIQGYNLTQSIEVRSGQVDLVDQTSREISELIASGVPLASRAPQYIYTKIGEVKVEILSKAAEDAKRRAGEIAKSSGATLGRVTSARMSPLQITPIYDYSVSGYGINDLSSKDKAITAIVTLGFELK
jgi:hypothetical protein